MRLVNAIAEVALHAFEDGQPGLSSNGPALVLWLQDACFVQAAQMDFDFARRASKQR